MTPTTPKTLTTQPPCAISSDLFSLLSTAGTRSLAMATTAVRRLHGEGNSVLVVGGRGTGKTLAVRSALAAVPTRRFIPIHLHGSVHTTDKMALREMARQIRAQGGTVTSLDALQLQVDESGEGGESTEHPEHTIDIGQSTLTALLTLLAASALPIVVVLDEFDLFAAHARQALLYCLLDCAQGGRRRGGLAVVGTTCRFDAVDMLEKRVKSRFSQRILHVSSPRTWTAWCTLARKSLSYPHVEDVAHAKQLDKFKTQWDAHVERLFDDTQFELVLKMLFDMLADIPALYRVFAIPIANATPEKAFPPAKEFLGAYASQRPTDTFYLLDTLPLPAIALVIAAKQISARDMHTFTFELVNKEYDDWARRTIYAPTAASVDMNAMTNPRIAISVWPRHILMGAFDTLVLLNLFIPVSSASALASGEMREVAMGDGDGDGSSAGVNKSFKTPAKGGGRGGKENAIAMSMSMGKPGSTNPLKTPLPSKKPQLFGEVPTTVKSKKTMTGLTPAPPKTVLRPAAGQNVQNVHKGQSGQKNKDKDPSPRPSTLRKSMRVPTHQTQAQNIKATPAPTFMPIHHHEDDVGPTLGEMKQEEKEQAMLELELEEEAYHESDWSDFEVEYAPGKETQIELPSRPLESESESEVTNYRELGRQLRIASPRFSVYESDDSDGSYASDQIADLKTRGGFGEEVKMDYDSGSEEDIGIRVKKKQKGVVGRGGTVANTRVTTQRRPVKKQAQTQPPKHTQTHTHTRKIKLDDIRVELDLESCLLDLQLLVDVATSLKNPEDRETADILKRRLLSFEAMAESLDTRIRRCRDVIARDLKKPEIQPEETQETQPQQPQQPPQPPQLPPNDPLTLDTLLDKDDFDLFGDGYLQ
ncbi:hypothetical protein E3P77_02782 [Wallemia ichthyophaga]|uniref:Origin recognition complex subunit 4 n=1 Tax=Wallemia ichthyophaga TaxID=245174 RepID=A0A4T0I2X8_WALIC|nr:hypothetical protein E3P93_03319 [Wallemia ichthyophaga]TIB09335.1 hypothetical protein E3P90_03318 [Wallemia ichthyophaga]TIB20234.1 hypothetical protein E3P89_03336 [Wallemia ichthyophaga]TIB21822.1 hypothetical protein E3P88_03331 [Wallemia ichthyophaga]TIB65273.1 hypothetical protein E3P77_02782 [Wallemia ichthyophaga]